MELKRQTIFGLFCVLFVCLSMLCYGFWARVPFAGISNILLQQLRQSSKHVLRPNIIFVLIDDLGYGDVKYNGGLAHTPNLDAMAKGPNSIKLTRHYSGGPTCSPTRGTVLTGRNHNRYCIWGVNKPKDGNKNDFAEPQMMPLPPSEVTVAEVLKQHGYLTGVFGKWHIGDLKVVNANGRHHEKWPVSHPGMHGFDRWWVTARSTPSGYTNCGCFSNSCYTGHYARNKIWCNNYYTIIGKEKLTAYPKLINGSDSHFILRLFTEFLQEAVDQTFFVYLPFHAVHGPYFTTRDYAMQYTLNGADPVQADYYGTITALDDVIGKIRKLLKEFNISENTLLWFTSDNGPDINSPGSSGELRSHKATLFEGGIRVPGIIEWPALVKTNRIADFPVVTNDLLPTIYDILDIKSPSDRPLDGISIMPFIRGETLLRNKSIPWAYKIVNGSFDRTYTAALSGDRYKLIAMYGDSKVQDCMLFDLLNDPREKNNIATDHPGIVNSMRRELEEWRQSVIKSASKEAKCLGYATNS